MEDDREAPVVPIDGTKGRRWFPIAAVIVFLIILIAGAGAYYWYNRPIKPVELSARENAEIGEKIEAINGTPEAPSYEPGEKEITFTERELNGLLNGNTNLGESLKLTLDDNEIHARIETDMDDQLPVVGGKRLKVRARFLVREENGSPSLELDDVTVWGVSLPNEWLGGLKGKDLLGDIFGTTGGLNGVRELRIERGRLVIKLED